MGSLTSKGNSSSDPIKKWINQDMLDQETIKSALTLIGTFLILLLAVFFGWYLMWKLFLSRFRFIRELLSVEEGDREANLIKKTTKRKIRRD